MRNGNRLKDVANAVTSVVVPALHRAATLLKRSGIDTVVHADSMRHEARLEFVTPQGARRAAAGGRFMHLGFAERGGMIFVKGYGPFGVTKDGAIDAAQITDRDVLQRALAFGWQTDGATLSAAPPQWTDHHA